MPVFGRKIGIWNGTNTVTMKIGTFSVSLSGKTAQNYRLYVYDSNSDNIVDTGELVAWTNSTTPPSDTLVSDGYYVKTGSTSHRAVADILVHATGQCDWRDARRGLCHLDERMRFPTKLTAFPNISTWVIARSTTWRRINAGATIGEQFVEFILSSSDLVGAEANSAADQSGSGGSGQPTYELGIGLDTTSSNSATQSWGLDGAIVKPSQVWSRIRTIASVGKRTINLVEQNVSNRDVVVYGNNGGTVQKSGMIVELKL